MPRLSPNPFEVIEMVTPLDAAEMGFPSPVWQCINCGAHAECSENIEHYEGCVPGEAERWAEYYSEPD